MKITNEFTIDAPITDVWPVLLDIPRVATCLPGATLEERESEDVYRGKISAKVGPVSATYAGTAKLVEVDEDDHVMVLIMNARETKGQGLAEATVTSQVAADGPRTRVVVETDLNMSGAHAQFGRGILENVAGAIIKQFVTRLEAEITAGGPDESAAGSTGVPAGGDTPRVEEAAAPLNIGSLGAALLPRGKAVRAVASLFAVAALGAVVVRARGPRTPRTLDITIYVRPLDPWQ